MPRAFDSGLRAVCVVDMGRLGTDQPVSARKKIDRWGKEDVKAEEAAPCDSAVLSIRKLSESSGKYAHVVECRLATTPSKRSLFTVHRRVFPETRDDPDGRGSALRFSFTTHSQHAFRSFLFGKSEHSYGGSPLSAADACSSDRVDRSCVGTEIAASSCARITAYVSVRQNTIHDLWFTTAACRLSNGSLRSVSFRNLDKKREAEIGRVAAFLRSAGSKRWLYSVVSQTMACGDEAGHCRQNGEVLAKCKRCGGLEHQECYGQTACADKQASEDYICSTCLMAEREEIFVIRMEEQAEGATSLEELRNEATSVYMESDLQACCVCGCEVNEDLNHLIPCLCDSSAACVHMSCAARCKASPQSSPGCLICGKQGILRNGGLSSGGENECKTALKRQGGNSTGLKRSLKSTQAGGKGVKRPRTTATNGTVKVEDPAENEPLCKNIKNESTMKAGQAESKDTDTEKPGVGLRGRRFNDAPAIVPIKKRRIQMPEVVRSPSPLRSPSPRCQSYSPTVCSPTIPSTPWRSPSPVSPTQLPQSTSPGSSSLSPRSPMPQSSVSVEGEPSTAVDDALAVPGSSVCVEEPSNREEDMVVQSSLPPLELGCMVHTPLPPPELGSLTHSPSPIPRLPSPSSLSSDENLKVEDEEVNTSIAGPPVEDDRILMDESSEEPMRNTSHHSAGGSVDEAPAAENPNGDVLRWDPGCMRDDRWRWDLNMEMEAWEKATDQAASTQGEAITIDDHIEDIPPTSTPADSDGSGHDKLVDACVGGVVLPQEDEAPDTEGNADDDGSQECRDVDSHQGEGDERTLTALQDESDSKAKGVPAIIDFENLASCDGETASDGGEGEAHEKCGMPDEHQDDLQDDQMPDPKVEKQGPSRNKVAGWDQLPDELEAEEHVDYGDSDCKDADDMGLELDERISMVLPDEGDWKTDEVTGKFEVDNRVSWDGDTVSDVADTREKSGVTVEVPKASVSDGQLTEPSWEKRTRSERTKTTGWDQLPEGFDSVEEARRAVREKSSRGGRGGVWSRGSVLGSQGALAGSRLGSGRGASRTDSFSVDRFHSDELSRGRDTFTHGRRLDEGLNLKFTSRDTGRGRSFGRGGPTAGMHGRGRTTGWVDPQNGSLGQWGPGKRRSTIGFSLQGPTNAAAAAAAKVESSGFVVAPDGTITKAGGGAVSGRGIRSTIGVSRDVHSPHVNAGRGSPMEVDTGMNFSARAGVGSGRGLGTSSSTGMNAGGRGILSAVGSTLAGGPAERGRSAGRGLMDRYREHSFGSGGMDHRRSESPHRPIHPLDHANLNSRAPQSFRPESRIERSKTPPSSHHSLGHSKFVPSVSGRMQRSPPSTSRWSSDKREPDAFRDRDLKRPLTRPRIAPRRTSPHVVHGSSLMDERDRQVLAGARHSPPIRVLVSSSVSSVVKSVDGSSETRRSKRDDEEDIRLTGSRSKEVDYCRSSPRDGDKDKDNRGSVHRRDRNRDDDRKRDAVKLSGKDGRSTSGHKHGSIRDVDDDVAPRRRRPS